MRTIAINGTGFARMALYDFAVFTGVYFIPAISHVTSLPLYLVEPMRLLLITLILLTPKEKTNHIFVAFTLPFVSYIFSGHPLFLKSLIMSMELVANVFVLHYLINKTIVFGAFGISIIVSKIVYYILKYVFISLGLLNMALVSTSLLWQVCVMFFLSIFGGLICKKRV